MATRREKPVVDLVVEAEQRLGEVDPGPFTPQAFELLRLKISAHISDLVLESSRIAKRRKADCVSAAHVEIASDHLGGSPAQQWHRHIGTVGGIFLGAAMSNFLAMVTTSQFSGDGVTLSATLAIVGAFAVAFQIGRG